MKKIRIVLLSLFLPFILVLGFGRKAVNEQQRFLPSQSDILNMLTNMPDFNDMITEDIEQVNSFWNDTKGTFFSIPSSDNYGDIWSGANKDNWFQKMGATFKLLFDQIASFFQCFVPFFKMIGSSFKLVGHAIEIPFVAVSWLWNNLLGFHTT